MTLETVKTGLDTYVPEWQVMHRLWSFQITVFWGCVQGLYVAIPVFADYLSRTHFIEVSIGVSILIAVARVTHQPGVE